MAKQHDRSINGNNFVPIEGQRDLLCGNIKSLHCPSFGFSNFNDVSKDVALDYLASLLVEAFLDQKENECKQLYASKKGGYLCASVNKRTG